APSDKAHPVSLKRCPRGSLHAAAYSLSPWPSACSTYWRTMRGQTCVLQGYDSLCPVCIGVGHSRWNTTDRLLRVTGCGVRLRRCLQRLGPVPGEPGFFIGELSKHC